MDELVEFCRMPVWYAKLSQYAFPTRFVPVSQEAAALMSRGNAGENLRLLPISELVARLDNELDYIPGNCFASVDTCAPTDTDRYYNKRGATYSAKSTFRNLAASEKVRQAAEAGLVKNICLRPYRRMSRAREFRLFIVDGVLKAMSQYHLLRHFRRLEGVKQRFWTKAVNFVEMISPELPKGNLVMDVYFTSSGKIMIVDFNTWGAPTDPLMLMKWDRDWSEEIGIVLMAPPMKLTGNVNISF